MTEFELPSELQEFARPLGVPEYPRIEEGYLPDNVLVHFHFAPHGTSEHLEGVEQLMPQADVFIPELTGWDASDLKKFAAISKGDRKTLDKQTAGYASHPMRDWLNGINRALFDTWKPVILIDQSAHQQGTSMTSLANKYMKYGFGSDIEEGLHKLADMESEVMKISALRNLTMIDNLGQKVTELVSNHPKLKNKAIVNVLATMGFGHMDIYEYLHSQSATADKVAASMWSGIGELSATDKVNFEYLSGRTPSKDELVTALVARAIGTVPSFVYKGERMYTPDRSYAREKGTEQLVAETTIRIMKSEKEGQQLALDWLRGLTGMDNAERLMGYMDKANKIVFEATGQSIELDYDS